MRLLPSQGTLQLVSCGIFPNLRYGNSPPYNADGPSRKPTSLCHEEFDQLKRTILLEAEKPPERACDPPGAEWRLTIVYLRQSHPSAVTRPLVEGKGEEGDDGSCGHGGRAD